ncbi:DUF1289 domain-containing protein [Seongchinamella sediminis]|uniref:DUF1289 domain-containing protein n=1 Tax=Seongchinamella sediminis TaxID=2283635 RepID=A0A3L7DZR4_9GAMM|nr:DUF1289 domain-containing protein [Seongchinamella sediminis]RLQ22744.1 DUF1289 domain-containing protein [Seongchinamella sediminis]
MNDNEVPSPCVSICVLDDDDICLGCFRSAKEITDWFMETPEGKQDILQKAIARRRESSHIRLG